MTLQNMCTVFIVLGLYMTKCTSPYLVKLLIYLVLIACKEVAKWWQLLTGLLNNEESLLWTVAPLLPSGHCGVTFI